MNPEVAYRDCRDCLLHEYDHKSGERLKGRGGLPILRTSASHVPCQTEIIGCAKGSPVAGSELSDKNWRAYRHYKRCRAIGRFPEDSIVEQHAEVIGRIEEVVASGRPDIATQLARLLKGRSSG